MKTYKAVANMLLMRPRIEIKLSIDESSGLGIHGGILIPEGSKVGLQKGESPIKEFRVIAKGPECKVVEQGDIVLVNGHIAMRIPVDGDGEIIMIAEHQIVAVVKDDGNELAKTTDTVG